MAPSVDDSTSSPCAPQTAGSSLSSEDFSVEAHKPSVVRLTGFRGSWASCSEPLPMLRLSAGGHERCIAANPGCAFYSIDRHEQL